MKEILIITAFLLALCGCQNDNKPVMTNGENTVVSSSVNTKDSKLPRYLDNKVYIIPEDKQKKSYSVKDFTSFYIEYMKMYGRDLEALNFDISEVTTEEVKKEIGCQIFRLNGMNSIYVVYRSRLFSIGNNFGGFGITSIKTCDFDQNGQKDLIYTYSFGSGFNRSNIGILNFNNNKEEILDFMLPNKDTVLEKISDTEFKVYSADVSHKGKREIELTSKELVADIKAKDKRAEVTKYNK